MKYFLPARTAATLLAFFAGAAVAQDVRKPPSDSDRAHIAKLGREAAAQQIGEALRKGYQPGRAGLASSAKNPAFQSWLRLYQWSERLSRNELSELARFLENYVFYRSKDSGFTFVPPGYDPPEGAKPLPGEELLAIARDPDLRRSVCSALLPDRYNPGPGRVAEGLNPEFLDALTRDDAFLGAFLANLSERDFTPLVLKNLEEMWTNHRKDWEAYKNLAIAIALVHDQKPPAFWPHDQVKPEDVPKADLNPGEWFAFWVASNEKSRMHLDLRKLLPDHLKFVVDAPVEPAEIEWAQKSTKFSKTAFDRAFSSISYENQRISDQAYVWPGGPYTLAAIKEHGGICVDQAYFAMLSGKAWGLPTLYFSGQGSDGGHAWFGYMKGEDRWDMDCGRYENQNYAVGVALDPQTWLPISDHELESLAASFRRTADYQYSHADIQVAEIFRRSGENEKALAALDSAIGINPHNDLAWNAKTQFLEETNAGADGLRAHHEAALRQFKNNDDLKVRHQRALAELARTGGNEDIAQEYEAKIISQNRRGRSDLSVSAAAEVLSGLVEARKLDEAMQEYRALLARLGRTSGGNFYYEIVRPFSTTLLETGEAASAKRAVELARSALRPESGSILDQELHELETQVGKAGAGK